MDLKSFIRHLEFRELSVKAWYYSSERFIVRLENRAGHEVTEVIDVLFDVTSGPDYFREALTRTEAVLQRLKMNSPYHPVSTEPERRASQE